jgi:hypothetical protein
MSTSRPRKCIFCDTKEKLTKEHLWSKWLRQLVSHDAFRHQRTEKIFKLEGIDLSVRTYGGDARNRGLKAVCRDCNSGWMSSIDERAKGVLTPLIKGERFILDKDRQLIVATWIAMKAMVSEFFFDASTVAITPEEREFLRERKEPPDKWKIWIGNYNRGAWDGQLVHAVHGIGSPESIAHKDPKWPNTQTTTLVVGHLYCHIFSSDISLRISLGEISRLLAQVWPIQDGFVAWPTNVIDDTTAAAIATTIFKQLGEKFSVC